ncbi:hypothetical protein QM012_002438 [Aureobasidium pullulans]|uniref:Xylanolytic transcriptional activator regulatory domain-containing protein n=1 Tax=Aureobasidium pullulans TaxID=5580 RepID=A0ABR0TBX7_AURPU
MVQDLIHSKDSSAGSERSTLIDASQEAQSRVRDDTVHLGASHWSAMLEDIEELRATLVDHDYVSESYASSDESVEADEIALLFGAAKRSSLTQILSDYLPSKSQCDRLFQRQYQLFWRDHASASPLWISLLFSILNIANKVLHTNTAVSSAESATTNSFDKAAAYCMVIGQYHQPKQGAVEALLLFAQALCLASSDISADVSIVFGTLVRLATVMGYHRDPDETPNKFSAFDGEMRRRAWSVCMQLDMLVSFQLGLPSVTQYPTWTTKPPTNLLDSDFDVDSVQLPPPRPVEDLTPLIFCIVKHKYMAVFEKVLRHALSPSNDSIPELEVIDKEVKETLNGFPDIFKARAMADSIVDSPSLTVTRMCVFLLHHKCLCVLHRRHAARGRIESLQTCYDSSTNMLTRYVDTYKEFAPGGQLETERWFMGSISWHFFLTGVMALCLVLCSTRDPVVGLSSSVIVDIAATLRLLQDTKGVLDGQLARGRDTKRVQQLVMTTIQIFDKRSLETPSSTELPLLGNQDALGIDSWQVPQQVQALTNGLFEENISDSMNSYEWADLEQFLNLSDEQSHQVFEGPLSSEPWTTDLDKSMPMSI